MKSELLLKRFGFVESRGDVPEMSANDFDLTPLNLVIGDNAQGKSRVLRTIHYLSTLVSSNPAKINTDYRCKMEFKNSSNSKIEYILNVIPNNQANRYEEEIYKDEELIFSTSQKVLIDEVTKENVTNFFIPENVLAVASIKQPAFPTIELIRNFLSRIVYVSSVRSRNFKVNESDFLFTEDGSNISSVLWNWKSAYPTIFNSIENEFLSCYEFIKGIKFSEALIPGIKAKLLALNENDVKEDIGLFKWSDGLYRVLFLIAALRTPFKMREEIVPPSLILVDEIENGLDYKTLKYILRYYNENSDISQSVITSHSPLVCDFVDPDNWLIAVRKASTVHLNSPKSIENDLDSTLDFFKRSHWKFYRDHISKSKKYKDA